MREPTGGCRIWMLKHKIDNIKWIPKKDFDKHYNHNDFNGQPQTDAFGDGYGDPYNPWRQAYGVLKNGDAVYCERHSDFDRPERQYQEGSMWVIEKIVGEKNG